MPRLNSLRVALMLTAAMLCAHALFAEAPETQRSYVITVQAAQAVDGTRAIARQIAASYGGTVVNDAAGGDSFVLKLPNDRLRVLAADPRIASVLPLRSAANAVSEIVKWTDGVAYTYDGDGAVKQIGDDNFVYDDAGRLVQAKVNGTTRKYGYDGFGSRTECTQTAQNDCQVLSIDTAAKLNRFRSSDASYDAAGNILSVPLWGHSYSWDEFNMMTRDQNGSVAREFVYTVDDERIATYTVGSSWRWTIRDTSGKPLREFSSQGAGGWKWVKDYVWRDGLLLATRQLDGTNATTYHYHLDHLGTPRRITDQGDQVVGVHDYYAFGPEAPGGTAEKSLSLLKYTGHERDLWSTEGFDTLDYMHARYYSPTTGRFLSVDADMDIMENLQEPQRWNRYAYVTANPLRSIDPDGLADIKIAPPPPKTVARWTPEQKALENQMNQQLAADAANGGVPYTPDAPRTSGLRQKYEAQYGKLAPDQDLGHVRARVTGGTDEFGNLTPQNMSVNRSNGARLGNATRSLKPGARITGVSYTVLSVLPYFTMAFDIWVYEHNFRKHYHRDPSFGETAYYLMTGDTRSAEQIDADWLKRAREPI